MQTFFEFTGDLAEDWDRACAIWSQSENVLSGEVGPRWETPPEHRICVEFAQHHPRAKVFLTLQLLNPAPRIAAYAFKILIRMDVVLAEIPPAALERDEDIGVHVHSRIQRHRLGDWIGAFFAEACDETLEETDEITRQWQEGPLAEYQRAIAEEHGTEGNGSDKRADL